MNGSAQCQPCAAGSFSPSQGLSACTVCEMGKFSGVPQSAECEECAGGKYADNSNMTSCLPCAAGKYASKGWSVCKNCSIGFYSEGAKAFCESCGNGYNTSMQMSVSIEDCLKICNEGPGFVPSYLFPATPQANEISAGMKNNKFGYWFFSSEADGTNITRMQFLITIPDGYYSPVGLANFVSQQASAQYNRTTK